MTPPTLGPAVIPRFVRPIGGLDSSPDRPLLRLYVGPRFFMGAVPPPMRAWAGIPPADGEQPVIVALQQWRDGALERLGWPSFDMVGAESGNGAQAQAAAVQERTSFWEDWTTPSEELTFKMLNVSCEQWQEILGPEKDFAAALAELTGELREDLVATIADIAFSALAGKEEVLNLTSGGRFVSDFTRLVMRVLPIDPYVAPRCLLDLYKELLEQVQWQPLTASWGALTVSAGNLIIRLAQPATTVTGSDASAPVAP